MQRYVVTIAVGEHDVLAPELFFAGDRGNQLHEFTLVQIAVRQRFERELTGTRGESLGDTCRDHRFCRCGHSRTPVNSRCGLVTRIAWVASGPAFGSVGSAWGR